MYPFRNILFPTDFKPHTRAALKYASAFARSGDGRVVVFSVQNAKVPTNLLTEPEAIGNNEERWMAQLRDDFRDVLADPLFKGLDVEPVVVAGEPATEIARAARALHRRFSGEDRYVQKDFKLLGNGSQQVLALGICSSRRRHDSRADRLCFESPATSSGRQ